MAPRLAALVERLEILMRRFEALTGELDDEPLYSRPQTTSRDVLNQWRQLVAELGLDDEAIDQAVDSLLPLPDVDRIVDAMRSLGAVDSPVHANAVANEIWHGEHGHSEVVRLGQRLGMMASVGLVVRGPLSRRRFSWSLPPAVDDRRVA